MVQSAAAAKPDSPRKLEIAGVASTLFQQQGFHQVSMDDIAKAVGLRGPALYRHFRSKQELLARVSLDQISACVDVAERAAGHVGPPQERLQRFVGDLARLAVDRDDIMLWRRERRRLDTDAQREFRRRARLLERHATDVLHCVRPDLGAPDIELLSWSLLSTFAHTHGSRRTADSAGGRQRALTVLTQMAIAVATCDINGHRPADASTTAGVYAPSGRRERLLETATRLFDERGYFEVSMEDIAAASDTAIATIYQYFESKASLLYTILDRGMEGVNYVTTHLLAGVESGGAVLEALIANYIDLAMGPHRRMFRIFDEELTTLPEQQRAALILAHRGHVDEWVGALQNLHPSMTVFEARARARTATGVASDISQTARLRERPTTRAALTTILGAIAGCPAP
ncbi:TetR/AcrR family transcriptional regulator [Mycolicibacterium litorale]|uniref:TetR/AcrR family transcriptional regulator n=1 Tax=Mycolicibacterium litorale TaxID=758802 RepID=UPI003CEF1607